MYQYQCYLSESFVSGGSGATSRVKSTKSTKSTKDTSYVSIAGVDGGVTDGVYKPVTRTSVVDLTASAVLYVKVDDGNRWLEYRAAIKQWQAKATADKGTDNCTAYCAVPAKCLPEDCPRCKWLVHDGTMFEPRPAVTISALTNDDVEAYYAYVRSEALRVAKEHHNVRIAGAIGNRADEINGMYEAAVDVSLRGDMPVYVKVGKCKEDVCLVYNATNKQWQVRGDQHTLSTHYITTHSHPFTPTLLTHLSAHPINPCTQNARPLPSTHPVKSPCQIALSNHPVKPGARGLAHGGSLSGECKGRAP